MRNTRRYKNVYLIGKESAAEETEEAEAGELSNIPLSTDNARESIAGSVCCLPLLLLFIFFAFVFTLSFSHRRSQRSHYKFSAVYLSHLIVAQ